MSKNRSDSDNYIALTIRKHRVKDYVDADDFMPILQFLVDFYGVQVIDYGIHTHGKYGQLHLHVLLNNPLKYFINLHNLNDYYLHKSKVIDKQNYHKYIHSEDHNSHYLTEQLLEQNYYRYHYFNQDTQQYQPIIDSIIPS